MDNIEYKIGQITSKVETLHERFNCFEAKNDKAHEAINKNLANLNMWRFKVVGGAIVLACVVNIVWDVFADLILQGG